MSDKMAQEITKKNERLKIIQRTRLQPDASLPNLTQAIVVAAPRNIVLRDISSHAKTEIITSFVRDLKENGKSRSDLATDHPYEFIRYWRDHCESEKSALFFHRYPEFILRIIRNENKPDEGKELHGVLAMEPSQKIGENCENSSKIIEVDEGRRTIIIARNEEAAQSLLNKANARVRRLLDMKKELGFEQKSRSLDFEDSSTVSTISNEKLEECEESSDSCEGGETTSKIHSNSQMPFSLKDLQQKFFHSNSSNLDDGQQTPSTQHLNDLEDGEAKTEVFGFTFALPDWLNDLPWFHLEKTEKNVASPICEPENFSPTTDKGISVPKTEVNDPLANNELNSSHSQKAEYEQRESTETSIQLTHDQADCSENEREGPQERDDGNFVCDERASPQGLFVETFACVKVHKQENISKDEREGVTEEVFSKALVIRDPVVRKIQNNIKLFDSESMFYDINTAKFVHKSDPRQKPDILISVD